jgi:N-acyl-L-homoserine lactone synthetase
MDQQMFDERYEVVVACTHVTRRIHHQIRYQVYCVEQGYEDPAQYPNQEEHDAWDEHAVHFLVRERSSGEWIGAMRLIRPLDGVLPIGMAAQLHQDSIPAEAQGSAWELSRTCILSDYRRGSAAKVGHQMRSRVARSERRGSSLWTPRSSLGKRIDWAAMARLRSVYLASIGTDRRPVSRGMDNSLRNADTRMGPLRVNGYEILAGMLRAAIEYARDHGTNHLFFLINRALARMVRRMEFEIVQVGSPVEHRGTRYPYIADLNRLVFGAVTRSQEMAKLFLEGADPYRYYSAPRKRRLPLLQQAIAVA